MSHLPTAVSTISEEKLDADYKLVEIDSETGVILAEKRLDLDPGRAVSQGQISGSGESLWLRARMTDYNPNLSGRQGIETYQEMRTDGVVRSTLRVAKTPILAARWFIEPASLEDADKERAQFIWDNLNEWMSISWPQFLIECLYMLDYGVSVFEKVFDYKEVDGEQRVIWKKFVPINVKDLDEFNYDDEGGPEEVIVTTDDGPAPIPISKALVFTYDKEAGDLWGMSLLRSAYKHWYYKEQLYKIDAIQKERHGIGIPVIVLPPNFTTQDKAKAEQIGMSLRVNERAHVVLPPGWEVYFLKLEGQRVDALDSADHHSIKIYESVLANFMINNRTSNDADVQEHVFTRAVRFVAEIIRDVLNKYAIPQLINFNWPEEELEYGYPQLKVRRIGDERDWRVISFAIRNLVGAGVVRPDDALEAWIRDELDMPVVDPETTRYIVQQLELESDDPDAQQQQDRFDSRTGFSRDPNRNAGNRQSQAGNMDQAQSPGRARAGRDGSGTSGTR